MQYVEITFKNEICKTILIMDQLVSNVFYCQVEHFVEEVYDNDQQLKILDILDHISQWYQTYIQKISIISHKESNV